MDSSVDVCHLACAPNQSHVLGTSTLGKHFHNAIANAFLGSQCVNACVAHLMVNQVRPSYGLVLVLCGGGVGKMNRKVVNGSWQKE